MSTSSRNASTVQSGLLLLLLLVSTHGAASESLDEDLIDAAQASDAAAVQALLKSGANPRYRKHDGDTALMRAADRGSLEIVRALLAAKADVNAGAAGWTPLQFAAQRNHVDVVRELLAAGAAPDPAVIGGGRTPLMNALSSGQMALAQALLEGGANVNATTNYGATPIRFAVWGSTPEHIRMVRELVARGAAVDAGHASSFRLRQGRCVELVVSAPCVSMERSAEGTALGDIAGSRRTGNTELMRALIAAGANVNARQPGWKTPLMLAAATGNLPGVQLLLESGADVNSKDSDDRTAWMLAQDAGHLEVAQLLRDGNRPATPQPVRAGAR